LLSSAGLDKNILSECIDWFSVKQTPLCAKILKRFIKSAISH